MINSKKNNKWTAKLHLPEGPTVPNNSESDRDLAHKGQPRWRWTFKRLSTTTKDAREAGRVSHWTPGWLVAEPRPCQSCVRPSPRDQRSWVRYKVWIPVWFEFAIWKSRTHNKWIRTRDSLLKLPICDYKGLGARQCHLSCSWTNDKNQKWTEDWTIYLCQGLTSGRLVKMLAEQKAVSA